MSKTIVYAHSVGVIGGAERVTLDMIRGLDGKYRRRLLAPGQGELLQAANRLGAEASVLDAGRFDMKRPVATVGMLMSAWRSLRQGCSLIHTGDIVAFRGLAAVSKLLRVPTVCHMHYPYPESFLRWVFSGRTQPTVFLFCSEELRLSIGELLTGLCPDSRQVVIHNGVDPSVFFPMPEGSSGLGAVPRIGIVANLQERKGHEDFLYMAASLKQQGFTAHFDVIGGDILQAPRLPKLKALARGLGLSDIVSFHGQLDDVTDVLNRLDIVVCASHEEAFPVSILEAMACQKAIVSTDVNGIPEALCHEGNAILVKPHRPEALASAVARLLDEPATASRLAIAARQSVLANFSNEAFRAKVDALYGDLVGVATFE